MFAHTAPRLAVVSRVLRTVHALVGAAAIALLSQYALANAPIGVGSQAESAPPTQAVPSTQPPAVPPAPVAPVAPSAPDTKPAPAVPANPPLIAVFQCESGTFKVELAITQTPRLCANFINLANRGYFDGKKWGDFSRVVRQTGLNPAGDPAYTLPREFHKDLFFDKPGRLCFSNNSDDPSKARAKPTRIFVTVREQDRWNLVYSAIGTITEGLDVAMNLKDGEKIVRVLIEGDSSAHQARYANQIAEWNAALDKVGLIDRR